MSKKTAFWALLGIASIFVLVNVLLGNYTLIPEDSNSTQSNTSATPQSLESTTLPPSMIAVLPKEVVNQKTIQASTLFAQLNISQLHLEKAEATFLFSKDLLPFGTVYQFSGGEKTYFSLKSALSLVLSKNDTIFDANNLGDYFLYYNDAKRPDSTFALGLIKGNVWGFEYPKKNHAVFKKMAESLLK